MDISWQAGGKNPVWNEEHAFEISSEKEAMIEILDKENVGQDKFMGELKVTGRRLLAKHAMYDATTQFEGRLVVGRYLLGYLVLLGDESHLGR